MTIKQYFRKRVLIGLGICVIGVILGAFGQHLGADVHYRLELVGFLLFLLGLLSVILIRCPSCGTLLGMQCVEVLRSKSTFNFCPNYGVRFSQRECRRRAE